jgi:hypothetical protein
MLRIPTIGFRQSAKRHNGSLEVQADWVEASALFGVAAVSKADIVDALIENQSYETQDFANEWATLIFRELERRVDLLGDQSAVERSGDWIKRRVPRWNDRIGHAFCVFLAVQQHYREEIEKVFGEGYGEQGQLFEEFSAEVLTAYGWTVHPVAWSSKAANSIEDKVDRLAVAIGEDMRDGAVEEWTEPHAKDAGLDLVAWLPHADGWSGRPVCLVQCASGANWMNKLHSPNISTWEKLIDFATAPRRGLTMPFAPEKNEFRRKANTDLVMMLMDRHRLIGVPGGGGPSAGLSARIEAWLAPRVAVLPPDTK